MRTTLDIDEDVLLATQEIANRKGVSIGQALSDLARQALIQRTEPLTRNGVPLFPRQPVAEVVTLELVNQLRDEAS
jgi:hypothetical protein